MGQIEVSDEDKMNKRDLPTRFLSAYIGRHELQALHGGHLLLSTVRAWCCGTPRAAALG